VNESKIKEIADERIMTAVYTMHETKVWMENLRGLKMMFFPNIVTITNSAKNNGAPIVKIIKSKPFQRETGDKKNTKRPLARHKTKALKRIVVRRGGKVNKKE
jgi:hypothetical protein